MMLSVEQEQRLLDRRAEADRTDPFATDPSPGVRRLGRLALRRSIPDPSDYFALGDQCAALSITNQRLLIVYVGKALMAYQKAGQIARAGERPEDVLPDRHSNDAALAERAIEAYVGWLLDAARRAPAPRNIAVALWAATELPPERQSSIQRQIVIDLARKYVVATVGGAMPDPAGQQTAEMPTILSQVTPDSPDDQAVPAIDSDTQDDFEDTSAGEGIVSPGAAQSGGLQSAPPAGTAQPSPEPPAVSISPAISVAPDQGAGDFHVGDTIYDPDVRRPRYEVRHILRGGMGIIYICYDRETHDRVALKTFQGRLLDNKRAIDRFTQEALTWIRLEKHPHIVQARKVQTFGSERVRERPHIILEYIAGPEGFGPDLKSWIEKNRLDLKTCIEIGLHICLGMQHAVRVMPGLVHRDLKPANILVRHDGLAKVTDFGLVRSIEGRVDPPDAGIEGGSPDDADRLTRAGTVVGTAPYMSPEQCIGAVVDLRSDIYAFGAILYEMLTGRRVFNARTTQEWLEAHVQEIPEFPMSAARIPPPLRDLTLRCLEKDREFRPQTWEELADELALCYEDLTGEPTIIEYSGAELEFREVMDKAYSLTELGYGEEALDIYDRALEISPREMDRAWVWARKGRTLRVLERYEQAISAEEEAVALKPDFAWAWQQMAIVYERLNDYALALRAYEQAAQKKPGDVWLIYSHARLLFQSGYPERALERIERALAVEPDHVQSHTLRGDLLAALNRMTDALEAFDRAIKTKPGYGPAWFGKGMLLRQMGRDAEAVSAFMQATRLQPGRVAPWLRLADTYNALGRHADALPVIQQAARIKPHYRGVWVRLGLTLRQLKRPAEADRAYEQALQLDPGYGPALIGRGEALEEQGQLADAITFYRRAAEAGGVVAYYRLGRMYYRQERHAESADAYRQAATINPESAWAWGGLGLALLRLRRYADALAALDRSIALNPHNSSIWNARGRALEKLKRTEDAVTSYERAADENPDSPWPYLNVVTPLLALARRDDALDAADQAIHLLQTITTGPGQTPASASPRAEGEGLVAALNAALLAAASPSPRPAAGAAGALKALATAWTLKGRVLRHMNRHDEAIEAYDKALLLDPESNRTWSEKGAACAALAMREEALACFARAAELAPGSFWAWYSQGEALIELGRYEEAIRALNRALELDPANKRAQLKRLEARHKLHRGD